MRVVSLVPSWTETLIECGVEVVGRTRYCIHPEAHVRSIPAVAGTKDWDWPAVLALKPDLLILDREENPKFMSEQGEVPYLATHVSGVSGMPNELATLAGRFQSERLWRLSERWRALLACPLRPAWDGTTEIPGLIEWGRKPDRKPSRIEYVIWKKPWMGVSGDTFIGSVLERCGLSVPHHQAKYPELDLGDPSTLLLFSSEPFPFAKIFRSLDALGAPYALVDGEMFSWFGVRSLRFLERVHGIFAP